MRDTWTVGWTFGTQGVKYSVGFLGHKAEQCGEGRLRHRPLKSRLVVVSVGRSWVKGVILVFQNSTFGHHLTEKGGSDSGNRHDSFLIDMDSYPIKKRSKK